MSKGGPSLDGDGVGTFPRREAIQLDIEPGEDECQDGGVVDETGTRDCVGNQVDRRDEVQDRRHHQHDVADADVPVRTVRIRADQPTEELDLVG